MGHSPYKDAVIGYVDQNPGCCKYDVAAYVTRDSRRNPSRQYYIVNTAINNGWIVAKRIGNRYELYLPEQQEAK